MSLGLCKAAVAAPEDNRYCNLFPFDENRVVLTGMKRDYINASWVRMEGLENKLILTMAPLHPDSQEGYTLCVPSSFNRHFLENKKYYEVPSGRGGHKQVS